MIGFVPPENLTILSLRRYYYGKTMSLLRDVQVNFINLTTR